MIFDSEEKQLKMMLALVEATRVMADNAQAGYRTNIAGLAITMSAVKDLCKMADDIYTSTVA